MSKLMPNEAGVLNDPDYVLSESRYGAPHGRRNVWSTNFIPHDEVGTENSGELVTRQEFAEECDINTIMKRFEATGVISHVDQRQPMYLDVSDVPDLQSALRVLDVATDAFMSLPAGVRREFDNDVHRFVAFAEDRENLAKMREWGLAPPEKAPEPPMRVEVVNPPPAPGGAPVVPA